MTRQIIANNAERIALNVEGRIQGVGFRPFVWRLANELALTGVVFNNSSGVRIEIQGAADKLDEFARRLEEEQPPLAKIMACERICIPVNTGEKNFIIAASESHSGQKVLVSPDVGVCADCLADMRETNNPRHGYAFTNCVNCGPRYSITSRLPYDRTGTVMRCFILCENCAKEYADPADRRFHAQPIACPKCGPKLWLVEKGASSTLPNDENSENAIARSARLLAAGKILALKGLGGFQLACDAANDESVASLRRNKSRPHKSFALMTANAQRAEELCDIGPEELRLLTSPARPITLCKALRPGLLSSGIAPDSDELGIMLPNTPLHALLFDELEKYGIHALVMTSGNRAGEPICLGNREALEKLDGIADCWLLHDRDILARVDDSVAAAGPMPKTGGKPCAPVFIRRARGYVPEALELAPAADRASILGAGAHLKATFCLTRQDNAFVSQHLGDLESAAALDFYEESLAHMERLLETRPQAIVRDLHPDYLSSRIASGIGKERGLPVWTLQHHAAHAAAVLAENGVYESALALCLDGTGLGTDGTIWGGELLEMNLAVPSWKRLGSFSPFILPGGEIAIRQPWRIALALDPDWHGPEALQREASLVRKILKNGPANAPTSSCGRLFDAVSARLGLCHVITYEGQAAMRLMQAANSQQGKKRHSSSGKSYLFEKDGLVLLDSQKIYHACAEIHDARNAPEAAWLFHSLLADNLAEMCVLAAEKAGTRNLGLSGGVFQNRIFASLLLERLEKSGLKPLWHRALPCGDGGLSFGQAVWGRRMLNSGAGANENSAS